MGVPSAICCRAAARSAPLPLPCQQVGRAAAAAPDRPEGGWGPPSARGLAARPHPATAAGSRDDDLDGIANDIDECPLTAQGVTVDIKGCPQFSGTLSNVLFATGSATLSSSAKQMLDITAGDLASYPNAKIQIKAYTDNTGNEKLNNNLSQQRASAVRSYLIGKGLPAERIEAKGFGEINPVASNDSSEGRSQNRRVEFVIQQ